MFYSAVGFGPAFWSCYKTKNNQTNQMKIATIYNYQETCILCTLQCQELGATERQLSFKLCCSRDTARTMFQCISNNYQYPKYILSYLILSTSPLNFFLLHYFRWQKFEENVWSLSLLLYIWPLESWSIIALIRSNSILKIIWGQVEC